MPKKEFGERLFALRKTKNISQAEVAEYIGLTIAAYQNYENGRREAGYDTISKLAKFYGVTTDYLLGVGPPPKDPIKEIEKQKKLDALEKALFEKYLQLPEEARNAFREFMYDVIESVKNALDEVPDEINTVPSAAEQKDNYYDLLQKSGAEMTDEEIELAAEIFKNGLIWEKEAAEKSSASSGFTVSNTQNDIENRKEA